MRAISIFAITYFAIGSAALGVAAQQQGGPGVIRNRASNIACGRFTNQALPAPTPQSDPHAMERFQTINKAVRLSPHSLLLLGDSLTEQWDPATWNQYLTPRGSLNAGINGDRTEHLLWRLQHGNLDGQSPKAVVLLIGTNDVGRNRPPDIVAEGIRANLELLRSHFPDARILLLGLLPRSQNPSSPRRKQVRDVNHLIRQCADNQRVFYAEIGWALLQPGGILRTEVSPDGVHLSPLGYTLLSKRLETELDRVLTGSAP